MRMLGLSLVEHAISWSTGGKQRPNDKLFNALATEVFKAESQLGADGALPTDAAAPRMKNKTFRQRRTPTADAEELATIAGFDLVRDAIRVCDGSAAPTGQSCARMPCNIASPASMRSLISGYCAAQRGSEMALHFNRPLQACLAVRLHVVSRKGRERSR
eukprot:6174235-Pleurochrysis_carterae.AAC.1